MYRDSDLTALESHPLNGPTLEFQIHEFIGTYYYHQDTLERVVTVFPLHDVESLITADIIMKPRTYGPSYCLGISICTV